MASYTKKIRFIQGYSESTWKSLVIKSLRIGWISGLEYASSVLSKSMVEQLLIAGLFEDVFPAGYDELKECVNEVRSQDYDSLLKRNTHHGRGYTDMFCDLEHEAVKHGRSEGVLLVEKLKHHKVGINFLSYRIFNCLYTWLKIMPGDKGKKREVFSHPFTGIPECVMDSHTYEGRIQKNGVMLLSGHYDNHRIIGQRVIKEGWGPIRDEFINQKQYKCEPEPKQMGLFDDDLSVYLNKK